MLETITGWFKAKAVEKSIKLIIGLIGISHYPLMIISVVGILIYACGFKKAGKISIVSFVSYFLLCCLQSGLVQVLQQLAEAQ